MLAAPPPDLPVTMRLLRHASVLAVLLVAVLGLAAGLGAQEMEGLPQVGPQAAQSLRPYWHVFAAYALAILLIGGWAISIARRLRDVEDRLAD